MRTRIRAVVAGLTIAGLAAGALVARATVTPDPRGARVVEVTVESRALHRRLPMTVVLPAGAAADRPLLVFLHGRGGDENSELAGELFAALARLGAAAPVLAFPNGGDHSYWHDRAGGAWGRYVLDDVIPAAVRATGADRRRVAIGGISMGGFGAYDLARLRPGRFCAVGGHSAAVWRSAADTAPGAFDDAADFARHDVIAAVRHHTAARLYPGTALWLDGGTADPFHAADEALAAGLGIRMHVWPGGHETAYWNGHWGSYLGFYAGALARCRR